MYEEPNVTAEPQDPVIPIPIYEEKERPAKADEAPAVISVPVAEEKEGPAKADEAPAAIPVPVAEEKEQISPINSDPITIPLIITDNSDGSTVRNSISSNVIPVGSGYKPQTRRADPNGLVIPFAGFYDEDAKKSSSDDEDETT